MSSNNRNGLTYSESGKLGGLKYKEICINKRNTLINEYYKHPNLCLNCNKIIPYEIRNNKCCCRSCATSYSNKKRGKRTEVEKHNISNGLLRFNSLNKKIKLCKYCGQPINNEYNHDICKKYRIFKSLEKFGFNKDVIGTIYLFDEYNRIKQLIEDFYILNGSNEKLLKETFNYTSGSANFHKLLKTLNIKTRNLSESAKEAYLTGRQILHENKNNYHSEWHNTWDGKEVYLRSGFELDYANELDKQQIKYEVEGLRIKYFNSKLNEYHCAIPDFYLPDSNTIVEIKSNYTLDIQEMKDKAKAYKELGYNFKLILEHKEQNIEFM